MSETQHPHNLRLRVVEHVRAAREAAGLSRNKFGPMAGLDRSYYARIERGDANITLETLDKLSAHLIHYAGSMPKLSLQVSRRLRELRADTIAQEKLSEKAGVSVSYVGKLERGDLSTTVDQLELVANALGIEPEELLAI